MARDEPQLKTESFFEREFATAAVKILPGEYFATAGATAITTLLGSCVSVCLYDRISGIGGMNHFMLPELMQGGSAVRCTDACCARYGSCAMRQLLKRLELLGASRSRLEAKLFGAGRIMAGGGADIGEKNAAFALAHLKGEGIPVVAKDLGGRSARRVIFFPATGRAFVKKVRDLPAGN
ncbi:MAG: histidine kinase [Geobacteraceae bacterium GWC2_58_44]|nr:MAG: histidine kinase [Geobacteraceae bacterium GWC2_58_44]